MKQQGIDFDVLCINFNVYVYKAAQAGERKSMYKYRKDEAVCALHPTSFYLGFCMGWSRRRRASAKTMSGRVMRLILSDEQKAQLNRDKEEKKAAKKRKPV